MLDVNPREREQAGEEDEKGGDGPTESESNSDTRKEECRDEFDDRVADINRCVTLATFTS